MVLLSGIFTVVIAVTYVPLTVLNSLRIARQAYSTDTVINLVTVLGTITWGFWVFMTVLSSISGIFLLVNLKRYSQISSQARERFTKMTVMVILLIATLVLSRIVIPVFVLVLFTQADRLVVSHIAHDTNISASILIAHAALVGILRPPKFISSRLAARKLWSVSRSGSSELKHVNGFDAPLDDFELEE